jgi:hypothetical protein
MIWIVIFLGTVKSMPVPGAGAKSAIRWLGSTSKFPAPDKALQKKKRFLRRKKKKSFPALHKATCNQLLGNNQSETILTIGYGVAVTSLTLNPQD